MDEAPRQKFIDTMMVKRITDDHVVFFLVSSMSLFRVRYVRPICLGLEIDDYISVPRNG